MPNYDDLVAELMAKVPALKDRVDPDDLRLPYMVGGSLARMVIEAAETRAEGRLGALFAVLNELSRSSDPRVSEWLAFGVLEVIIDSPLALQASRSYLSEKGRELLEEALGFWGGVDQPT